MAFPIGAAVAAGASLIGSGGQALATSKMNRKTREWNEMMYARQREDALADWERQNKYNSPAEQMRRYEEAGLNKNLIYGQSHDAPAVRSTDSKAWTPEAPNIRGFAQDALSSFQDYALQSEQLKNMEQARMNMEMDTMLKSADLAQKNLTHDQSRILFDTTVKMAQERLRAMTTDTDIAISKEVRDAAMHTGNLESLLLKVAGQRTDNEMAIEKLKTEPVRREIMELERNMRRLGMSYNDNGILRALATLADGRTWPEVMKAFLQAFK